MYRNNVLFFSKTSTIIYVQYLLVSRLNAAAQFSVVYNENENISLAILSLFLNFSLNI